MKKILFGTLFVFLLLNLLAVISLLVYGLATGRFEPEKVKQYAATWRGEKLAPVVEEKKVEEEKKEEAPLAAEARIRQSQVEREMQDRELQRQVELLRSMQTTIGEARTKLDGDLKVLQNKEQLFGDKVARQNQLALEAGFQKALKNYSEMSPKLVKDDFMTLPDAECVAYLAAMKSSVATEILARFRTPEEQARRVRLIDLLKKNGMIELATGSK